SPKSPVLNLKTSSGKQRHMTPTEKRTSRKQQRLDRMKAFCGHLLSSKTLAEAAARAGITVRMATRWQRSEEFRDIFCGYFRADDLAIEQMAKSLSGPALAVAGKILTDPDAPATAKVQACAVINKFNI